MTHEPAPRVTYGTYQISCSCGYETPVFGVIKGMEGEDDQEKPKTQKEAWEMFRVHWAVATGVSSPLVQEAPKRRGKVNQSERLFE